MPYRSSRDADYILVRERKSRRFRDDDEDEDDEYHSEIIPAHEPRRYIRPHVRYLSSDPLDYDYRPQRIIEPAERIRVRKGRSSERIIYDDYDDDEDTIKIVRSRRSPSPVEQRRVKHRSSDRQAIYYERDDGRVVSRPPKKNLIHTRKTQVVYSDDEPTKVTKKVIIDPRTGHRETIYEKDRARKHQKYIVEEQPAEIVLESEEEDYPRAHYIRTSKHRPVLLSKYDAPKKYIKIRHSDHAAPVYSVTSKLPAIKSTRRIIYEVPRRKAISNYHY